MTSRRTCFAVVVLLFCLSNISAFEFLAEQRIGPGYIGPAESSGSIWFSPLHTSVLAGTTLGTWSLYGGIGAGFGLGTDAYGEVRAVADIPETGYNRMLQLGLSFSSGISLYTSQYYFYAVEPAIFCRGRTSRYYWGTGFQFRNEYGKNPLEDAYISFPIIIGISLGGTAKKESLGNYRLPDKGLPPSVPPEESADSPVQIPVEKKNGAIHRLSTGIVFNLGAQFFTPVDYTFGLNRWPFMLVAGISPEAFNTEPSCSMWWGLTAGLRWYVFPESREDKTGFFITAYPLLNSPAATTFVMEDAYSFGGDFGITLPSLYYHWLAEASLGFTPAQSGYACIKLVYQF